MNFFPPYRPEGQIQFLLMKKKIIYQFVDVAVPAHPKIKVKESEKLDKF